MAQRCLCVCLYTTAVRQSIRVGSILIPLRAKQAPAKFDGVIPRSIRYIFEQVTLTTRHPSCANRPD
jgi:hypothetical protein